MVNINLCIWDIKVCIGLIKICQDNDWRNSCFKNVHLIQNKQKQTNKQSCFRQIKLSFFRICNYILFKLECTFILCIHPIVSIHFVNIVISCGINLQINAQIYDAFDNSIHETFIRQLPPITLCLPCFAVNLLIMDRLRYYQYQIRLIHYI